MIVSSFWFKYKYCHKHSVLSILDYRTCINTETSKFSNVNTLRILILCYYFFSLYRMNNDVYVSPNVWKIYTVSYMHYSTIGFLVGMAVGLAVSLLFPTDQCVDPKLLAPWLRKLTHSKFLTNTPQLNGTREMTPYQPVSQNTTELWYYSKLVFKFIKNTSGCFLGAWQWLFINFILYYYVCSIHRLHLKNSGSKSYVQ